MCVSLTVSTIAARDRAPLKDTGRFLRQRRRLATTDMKDSVVERLTLGPITTPKEST